MSTIQCNHQQCQHTFPIYEVNDHLQLCIHPWSDNMKRQWQQCYHLLILIIYTEDVLSHIQTTSNHMGQDLESREDVPTPPSPNPARNFAHHNGDEVLHDPGAKWHNVQAILVVNSKQLASPYPARVCSNTCHWLLYKLAYKVKHKYTLAEEHDVHDFQSYVTFGHTIQRSVISAERHMNAPMIHQSLQSNWGTHCLHFSNIADGTWQEEHAWLFGHHWACVESTLHKLPISPSCWWGYGKHLLEIYWLLQQMPSMKYCMLDQGQISLVPCGIHPLPMLVLHCKGHHLSLHHS